MFTPAKLLKKMKNEEFSCKSNGKLSFLNYSGVQRNYSTALNVLSTIALFITVMAMNNQKLRS